MYRYYRVLNENMIALLKSIVFVKPVSIDDYIPQVRLREEVLNVSIEDLKRTDTFVTAHRLSDYKVIVGDIVLNEQFTTWLDLLLERSCI